MKAGGRKAVFVLLIEVLVGISSATRIFQPRLQVKAVNEFTTAEKPTEPNPIQCIEQFYHEHKGESFRVGSYPKGYTLIININKIQDGKSMPTREGSTADQNKMEHLFKNLGYRVSSPKDLNAEEFYDIMTDFVQQAEEGKAASVFVILMAHGTTAAGEQVIYLSDGKRSPIRREMEFFFNSRSAPGLAQIPKVFIIQACQGSQIDEGVCLPVLYGDVKDGSHPTTSTNIESAAHVTKVATFCEYLFANATQKGKVAVRTTNAGSWFIKAIFDVFLKKAATKHVLELFTEVRTAVSKRETQDGIVQYPETIDGLTKPFYIFPGIYDNKQTLQQ